jgi:hypothetical protein
LCVGFSHTYTHTQHKQKEQLKLESQKTILKKPKKGKAENLQETIEINNNFKKLQKKKKNIKNKRDKKT